MNFSYFYNNNCQEFQKIKKKIWLYNNYIPPLQNGVGLKLYLNTVIYTATSSSLGRVGGTSLSSRAARRR